MPWEYSHMLAVMQRGLIWALQEGGPCTHVVASLTLLRLQNPLKARKCNGRRAHIYGPEGYMGSHSRIPIRVGHLLCFLSVQFGIEKDSDIFVGYKEGVHSQRVIYINQLNISLRKITGIFVLCF